MFGKKKKTDKTQQPAKITIWAVIDEDFPETPISFTATHKDAEYALDQYLYLKHYTHFRLWCENHHLKPDHSTNWRDYARTVIDGELDEKQKADPSKAPYTLLQIDYEPNIFASLLRTFNHCVPMNCPYETDEELEEYANYYSQKTEAVNQGKATFTPLEKMFNRLFDDLEAEKLEENLPDIDSDHHIPNNAA